MKNQSRCCITPRSSQVATASFFMRRLNVHLFSLSLFTMRHSPFHHPLFIRSLSLTGWVHHETVLQLSSVKFQKIHDSARLLFESHVAMHASRRHHLGLTVSGQSFLEVHWIYGTQAALPRLYMKSFYIMVEVMRVI